jgi:hypothetical protein
VKCGGYPHPYFGRKILVFLRLRGGLRCKIVKTKEFPAKSSRIRSYGPFWTANGYFRLKSGALDEPDGARSEFKVAEYEK